jgi:hypothetical protein
MSALPPEADHAQELLAAQARRQFEERPINVISRQQR